MSITFSQVIVWLLIGLFVGQMAGALVTWKKGGYGFLKNSGIGLIGAIIGGLLFKLFKIDMGLGAISVSLEDLVSALIGALLLLLIVWIVKKRRE